MTDTRKGLRKVGAGKYVVLGRVGWVIERASKTDPEPTEIAGWWYLSGPGDVFFEGETLADVRDYVLDRVAVTANGGWL